MSRFERNQNKTRDQVIGIGIVDKPINGRFARVEVGLRPLESSDAPNQVTNAVVGATIPSEFIASVIDGVVSGLGQGPIGGFPVTGVEVRILGGKAHDIDSSPQAFKEAGRLAVQDALARSEAALLEPVATLEVTTPAEFVGTVVGDINRRRGQITDMTTRLDGSSAIKATVPLAETFGYATDLRSMTQGRAGFVLEPSGYAEAPASVQSSVAR